MKKSLFSLVLFTLFLSTSQAQDDSGFIRKGRILIETGYSFSFAGIGGNTGLTFASSDGSDIITIGFDGGYFLSEDFALKLKIDRIDIEGTGNTGIGIGGKYYAGGIVPIDVNLTRFSTQGESFLIIGATGGYAIPLAPNINLEPLAGIAINEGETAFQFALKFAMFL